MQNLIPMFHILHDHHLDHSSTRCSYQMKCTKGYKLWCTFDTPFFGCLACVELEVSSYMIFRPRIFSCSSNVCWWLKLLKFKWSCLICHNQSKSSWVVLTIHASFTVSMLHLIVIFFGSEDFNTNFLWGKKLQIITIDGN